MFDTKTASARLRAVGLTAGQANDLITLIQKWIKCSGEEWTVDRIKSIKLDLVRHYAGLPPVKNHSWIKMGPNGPKGPFGLLFRISKTDMRKAWNLIMVYTGLVYSHPVLRVTPRQWTKMIAAIKRPLLETDAIVNSIKVVHESPFYVHVQVREETGSPLVDYQASPSRRAPKGFVTVPEVEGVIDSLRPLIAKTPWTVQNWDILSGTCRGLENHILPSLELNLEFEEKAGGSLLDSDTIPSMGLISLIQEGGYKLRFAANPYRVYQMALQPLGNALFAALKRVPNDFTFDQMAGIEFVQSLLSQGKQAASMDLSNATDRAPFDAQLELLSTLGVSTRWLQFFRDCCRGDWYTKPFGSMQLVRWTVGSPLGLYPTFASFALWHHCVVRWCFHNVRGEVDGILPYAIVGDDVVICDWEVAELYRKVMESWGVEISELKTLWSNTTAEFLGRLITPNSVIQGFKWKAGVSDQNFIDLARNIGPGALLFMRPRQRRILQYIADLPEPYGLGWNPLGIPLSERLTPQIERIWSTEVRLRTFSRRSARSARLLYMSEDLSGTPVGFESDADFLASDQLADEVVAELLPGWESSELIWNNLPEVALFQGMSQETSHKLRLMLQRTSYVETRKEVSTLVELERKIRRLLARSR